MKVQAQRLQAGDVVGSGETILNTVVNSIHVPSGKVHVWLEKDGKKRTAQWGKYTLINIKDRG